METKFDISISFAGEDREVAESIASRLIESDITVFYDNFQKTDLWGKDLYSHLISVYRDSSKYCLMLLSENYAKKLWTNHERKAAQARAFRESKEYILPLRLDDSEVDGVLETTGYIDLRLEGVDGVVKLIENKLWGDLRNEQAVKQIANRVEDLYMRTMLTCDLAFISTSHKDFKNHNYAHDLFKKLVGTFNQFYADTHLLASTFDKLVLFQVSRVIASTRNILGRIEFLLLLDDPKCAHYLFVSEIPESDFKTIHAFLERLDVFVNYPEMNKKHFLPSEIVENWKQAALEKNRVCLDPKKFNPDRRFITYAFNNNTLRNLPVINMRSGDKVKVFKDEN